MSQSGGVRLVSCHGLWTFWVFVLLVALGCGAPRPSVDVSRPAVLPDVVVVRGAGVLDLERGVVVAGRDVTLEDGRIRSIEPTGAFRAPADALVIDGAGATLVPGLVDVHGHISADSAPSWARGLPDEEANLRGYLYAGVTTLLDPGDSSGDAAGRRDRIATGEQLGPHVHASGPIHTAVGGHPIALVEAFAPWWIGWYLAPRVAIAVGSEEEGHAAVDAIADDGLDFVKIVMDQIPLDAPRMSSEVAAAIVERAGERGLRVVAHIGTTQDAIDAAEAGVSLWVHGVYKERIPDAQISRLAGYGIPMVVTVEVFDRYARAMAGPLAPTALEREMVPQSLIDSFHPPPDDFDLGPLESWLELVRLQRENMIDNARRLREAGVVLLAGSDTQSGVFPGAGLHRELEHLTRAGLRPAAAIRAATLDAARFIEQRDDPSFGSVVVGKRADLLLVEGDPSRDVAALQRIRAVILEGVPLERRSLAQLSSN